MNKMIKVLDTEGGFGYFIVENVIKSAGSRVEVIAFCLCFQKHLGSLSASNRQRDTLCVI